MNGSIHCINPTMGTIACSAHHLMPNLRPVPIGENLHSSWQNVIQKTIQAQDPVAGSGLRTQNMGDFTRISLPDDINSEALVWRGDFDENAKYYPSDVIRVVPNVNYVDVTDGQLLEIGSTSDDGFDLCAFEFGVVCLRSGRPPSFANETYFLWHRGCEFSRHYSLYVSKWNSVG